ncbi:MAG: hypothetical protein WCL39_09565, partial [Armatimonadota bacterium]
MGDSVFGANPHRNCRNRLLWMAMNENLPPLEIEEIMRELLPEEEYHRQQATRLFDFVWSLLEQEERTIDETDAMINAAHAARFHWSQIGTPLHVAYSEWQISRVYAVLCRPEPAIYHAERCLAVCQTAEAGHFALAYAYEALARAHATAGFHPEAAQMIELSQRAGSGMESQSDKELLARDLMTIPGVELEPEEEEVSLNEVYSEEEIVYRPEPV